MSLNDSKTFQLTLHQRSCMKNKLISFGNKFRSFSPKAYWREILAVLMLLFAIFFFRAERKELSTIVPQLHQANSLWLLVGTFVTGIYIFFQGGMYRKSFAAIGNPLHWGKAMVLFLKRNLISVFLPAGGVSALAYSPSQIRKAGFNQTQVHQASGLFGFAGLLTVFLVGFPIVIFTIYNTNQFQNSWIGLVSVLCIIVLIYFVFKSLKDKGKLFQWLDKKFPSITPAIDELFAANVNKKHFTGVVLFSTGVELTGILHVYIAMCALGIPASFGAAAAAYIIAVLMMVISPFLRGLGAVELCMMFVLEKFGYSSAQSLSITIVYRVFEFWLPLVSGIIAFAWKGRKLFFRLAPAMLTFILGLINIISVVTPPIYQRLHLLREYMPVSAIRTSNLLVLFMGLALIITAAYLFRGLRNAWIFALTLSVLSLIGNITKALDYEESIVAALTLITLLTTAKQYRIRSSTKWMKAGLKTTAGSFAAVLIFGFISFYFIDVKHFGVDFTWKQSLVHTFNIFLLVEDSTLTPVTKFGQEFIWLIRVLGFLTWGFLLFALINPYLNKYSTVSNQKEKARFLLSQFGNSSTDYFKLYKDKLYFFQIYMKHLLLIELQGFLPLCWKNRFVPKKTKLKCYPNLIIIVARWV